MAQCQHIYILGEIILSFQLPGEVFWKKILIDCVDMQLFLVGPCPYFLVLSDDKIADVECKGCPTKTRQQNKKKNQK